MKFKLPFTAAFVCQILFSCSPQNNKSENQLGLLENFHKKTNLFEANEDSLNGVWTTHWKNPDGYTIHEFIVVSQNREQSYTCVLNQMGGYEYSPVRVEGEKLVTTFVDPQKNVYINNLGIYGKNNLTVVLNYSATSDTLQWAAQLENSERNYSYSRLSPTQKKTWELFNTTCGSILPQSAKVNGSELKIEKLFYKENAGTLSVLQTSQQSGQHTNYCIYNANTKTVLSLPVSILSNRSIAFSNLDTLSSLDRSRLFKTISTKEISNTISSEMLAACSALSKNTRTDTVFPTFDPFNLKTHAENIDFLESMESDSDPYMSMNLEPTSTYLVCQYRDAKNGSNSGWQWGEYPRWEWEKQTTSCSGIFSSNCLHLKGEWAREDIGLGAIGTMFVMDSTSEIEADLSRACNLTNQLSGKVLSRDYAQYHVADSSVSFNHTIWFKKVRTDTPYNLPFNRIVAFGDSLSDNGNLHNATGGLVAAGGYYQGRFSNGLVWVEYLSKRLGLDLYNWAVGAATSDFSSVFDLFKTVPYTIQNELADFKASIQEVGMTQDEISKMLFTILFGGNNFVHDIKGTPTEVSDDFVEFVDALVRLGAKQIMVVNLPDLSIAPKFNSDPMKAIPLSWKVRESNRMLDEKMEVYRAQNPQVTFYQVNLFEATEDALKDPSKYNIINTKDRCYAGTIISAYDPSLICKSPETHLFWDELHPASTFACQSADIAANIIFDKQSMPTIPVGYESCVKSMIH